VRGQSVREERDRREAPRRTIAPAAGNRTVQRRKPFGEHPGEQPVLHRVRQLHRKPRRAERLSYAEIAAQINAERLPTRTGKA
jgi:hypothetical protein